jgi:hypothetical protein
LNLTGWNAFLLLHPLDSLLNVSIFLYSKLLKVLIELVDPANELFCGMVKLSFKLIFVGLDLAVFKILHFSNGLLAFILVFLPVLAALSHPVVHKLTVFLQFGALLLPRILLHPED